MKKTIISLMTILAPVISGARDVVTRTLPVNDFKAIECKIACDIKYSVGTPGCTVTMPEKLDGHIVANVTKDTLRLALDKNSSFRFGKVTVVLSSSDLTKIALNGAIDFETETKISPERFEASINGASELDIKGLDADTVVITSNGSAEMEIEDLMCESIKVTVNGTGDCELKGFARKADLTVNGVGGIDIKDLKSENMNSAINGLGKISCD